MAAVFIVSSLRPMLILLTLLFMRILPVQAAHGLMAAVSIGMMKMVILLHLKIVQ